MDQNKKTLNTLVEELIILGEDREELSLLLGMFDALDEIARKELIENLTHERDELKKITH